MHRFARRIDPVRIRERLDIAEVVEQIGTEQCLARFPKHHARIRGVRPKRNLPSRNRWPASQRLGEDPGGKVTLVGTLGVGLTTAFCSGRWYPSFSLASSWLPSSTTGPLSLEKMTIVLAARPFRSKTASNSPTPC